VKLVLKIKYPLWKSGSTKPKFGNVLYYTTLIM